MNNSFYRHGDVNLHRVDQAKGNVIKTYLSFVVAVGEATSSEHRISVKDPKDMIIHETDNGERYIELLKAALITHTHDHETITIQPGIYKQVQEREVDHFANSIVRKVVD